MMLVQRWLMDEEEIKLMSMLWERKIVYRSV